MQASIQAVVPQTMERPKAVAKTLHAIYPRHQLAFVQEVVAQLYGHRDLYSLQQAIKVRAPSGPLDDDLDVDGLLERRAAQIDIVCELLGGGSAEEKLTDAESAFGPALAEEVVFEVAPTARAPRPKEAHQGDSLCLCTLDEMALLPAKLGQWWSVNIPHQPIVANYLKSYRLDPRSGVSLMEFGHYWATLSLHYAESLGPNFIFGPAYLLAERYATVRLSQTQEMADAIEALESKGGASEEMLHALLETHHELACEFLRSYRRKEVGLMFPAQPRPFLKAAEHCLKAFKNPMAKQRKPWR